MVTDTREKILSYISLHGRVRPNELVSYLGIGLTAIHRQLKTLVVTGKITRTGKPPLVFYVMSDKVKHNVFSVPKEVKEVIERTYLYVTPNGEVLSGMEAFGSWTEKIGLDSLSGQLAKEYVEARVKADSFFNSNGMINTTQKLKDTFEELWIDEVYCRDFYALPKFGKTKLGQLVLFSKLAQKRDFIPKIVEDCKSGIEEIIAKHDIDAVGFIPHSLPRKVQFLTEFSLDLDLKLPKIQFVKAYANGVPIAQKSLSKLEERMENARKTIEIKEVVSKYKNVLIIDDAIGSGSTFNEVARKLKMSGVAAKVYGFAVVGSMKDFEVINEI